MVPVWFLCSRVPAFVEPGEQTSFGIMNIGPLHCLVRPIADTALSPLRVLIIISVEDSVVTSWPCRKKLPGLMGLSLGGHLSTM